MLDLGRGRTYWFATKNAPEGEPDGGKAELLRRFGGWHEPVRALVESTPAEEILRNDVYDLDSLPRWTRGRIVLLGDAAHASTPALGQGAAQAIEDTVVLARCLEGADDVPAALQRYEQQRQPRTAFLRKTARRFDRLAQLDSRVGWAVRDTMMRRLPDRAARRQAAPILDSRL